MGEINRTVFDEDELWSDYLVKRTEESRSSILDYYLPLLKQITAQLYTTRYENDVDYDDHSQYGIVGLLEAIDRYDIDRGAQFSTYAAYRIRGAILNGLTKYTEKRQLFEYTRRLTHERLNSLGVKKHEGNTFQEILDITLEMAFGYIMEHEEGIQTQQVSIAGKYYRQEEISLVKEKLRQIIIKLDTKERVVIEYHYFSQIKFETIADVLSLSKGRVSQIHKQALKNIRHCYDGLDINKTY